MGIRTNIFSDGRIEVLTFNQHRDVDGVIDAIALLKRVRTLNEQKSLDEDERIELNILECYVDIVEE